MAVLCIQSEFENDVKMYGTQTIVKQKVDHPMFENDVKMYGTQIKILENEDSSIVVFVF